MHYTKRDYFEPDKYGMTQADYTAIQYKEMNIDYLTTVLNIIRCSLTQDEYEPNASIYCKRLEAKPNAMCRYPYPEEEVNHTNFNIRWIRDEDFKYGPECTEMDLMDAWNSHYDTLDQLFDLLVKWSGRTNWCKYYEDLTPRERRTMDRYFAVVERYNAEIQKALDEMCRIIEQAIDDDYKFAQTDECAEMWVANMNDRWYWKHKERIEYEREHMWGTTAEYEDYAA